MDGQPPRPTVSVVGIGKSSLVPDLAVLTLGSRARGDDPAAALARCSAAIEAIVAAVGPRSEMTQSSQLTVHPDYDHGSEDRLVTGYVAEATLIVRTSVLGEAGELAAAALEAAGETGIVRGLGLAVSDSTDAEARAREAALVSARTKAQHYASLVERRLGALIELSEFGGESRPAGAVRLASARAPLVIEPGEFEVVVQVATTWELLG